MIRTRTVVAGLSAGLALSTVPLASTASGADARNLQRAHPASQVLLDWETTSIRTIYTEHATAVPVGALYLGFTSLSMGDAVRHTRGGPAAAAAAAAVAAHDVLVEYFPTSGPNLDADLATSLGSLGCDCVARALRVGHAAAARMIAARVDDGRDKTSIVYSRPKVAGVWQPPATGMLAPWLGFVRPLVLSHIVRVPGPDALTSKAYAADYDEVRRLGSATSTERTAEQTDTALFFNSNSAIMLTEALVRRLHDDPISVRRTAALFAAAHGAEADSVIAAWRQKFVVGFWRPTQAIAGGADDGNPATQPEAGWTALLPVPPYADYVSGHASLTGPVAEVIRRFLGDRTTLELHSFATGADRTYTSISAIERDAFNARIWSGLHFRRAMVDGYRVAHRTADRVLHRLP
jgi:hypothetical protein